MMSQGIRSRAGFTLIEVLCAITIAAVLSGILLAVFASVRENGRRTACLSNERQLSAAMLQYVADQDESFPSGMIYGAGDKWVSATYPYMKSIGLFQCPDGDSKDSPLNPARGFPAGYGLNSNLGHFQGTSTKSTGIGLAGLAAPAKTVLFFEVESSAIINDAPDQLDGSTIGNCGDTGSAPSNGSVLLTDATYPTGGGPPDTGLPTYATGNVGGRLLNGATKSGQILNTTGSVPRHAGGSNYAACDGHVAWLRPEAVSGGQNAVADNCFQGTDPGQPSGCNGQTEQRAAGISVPKYALTFSVR